MAAASVERNSTTLAPAQCPPAFLCGADSELYPVAPRLLAKRIETGRRTLSAPAKAAMPADLAWAKLQTLVEGARLASTSLWP